MERLRVGEQESEKQKGQLEVARDHNKKLVELLQKMERKVNEKV